ncbi:hypothetical protein [Nonomuraea typhae]|uniref:DUF4255 domain-containing protein n=1 Tax=Nonomuraea typhae TaxID=2603600 RepID=A0ABW7YSQ4_9ACTN
MFFEPPTEEEESAAPSRPELPAWCAPPPDEMGAVIVSGLLLARTPNVVLILPTIEAFSGGCLLNVDIVTRRHTMSPGEYETLQTGLHLPLITGASAGKPLPDNLLRFGVRFADGTKTTTVGQRFDRLRLQQDPPPPPRLTLLIGSFSMRSGPEDDNVSTMRLWLWPLPPPEVFELAAEWPAAGVELTLAQLDGAAIGAGARQAAPYWPEA